MPVNEMYGMRVLRSLVGTVLALLMLATPAVVLADARVALVVGNSTYAHVGRLPNPENDATDISLTLRRLGFEVTTELDGGVHRQSRPTRIADRVELTAASRAFTRRSAGADISLVCYAGHDIKMDGLNYYLVPVDARLERDVDVRFETVTVDDLLVSTSGASLRLLILDAYGNNPLARAVQRTAATRAVSGGSFADQTDLLRDETLVAYAAAAPTTAADGRGRNSPYTAALLSHLKTPLEVGLRFRRVRAQVLALTNGSQHPHEYHSLVGEHYLTRTLAMVASTTVSAGIPADPAPADPPRPDPPEIAVPELHLTAFRDSAAAGDAEAQTELGERYEDGRGVTQNYDVAVSWFRRAAEPGCALGQFMYATGRGVRQDDEEAVWWYRPEAAQDAPRDTTSAAATATVLGCHGTTRTSCPGSVKRPIRGFAAPQCNVGRLYSTGGGVSLGLRDGRIVSLALARLPLAPPFLSQHQDLEHIVK